MIAEDRLLRYKEKLVYLRKTLLNLDNWTRNMEIKFFEEELELQKKYGIYHGFQIAAEIMVDIVAMLVKDTNVLPKDDYSNIDILVENKVIASNLGKALKETNGLRNRIVHEYNGLNDSIAFERITFLINNLEIFMEEVETWFEMNSLRK